MEHSYSRQTNLRSIAIESVELGNSRAALAVVDRMDRERLQNGVRAHIAEAQYAAGDSISAQQTLSTITKRDRWTDEALARGLAKSGAFSQAVNMAMRIEDMDHGSRVSLLTTIADEMRDANQTSMAKETFLTAVRYLKIYEDSIMRPTYIGQLAFCGSKTK